MTDDLEITDADREAARAVMLCGQCGGTGWVIPGAYDDGPADPEECQCGGCGRNPDEVVEEGALDISRAMRPERERAARIEKALRAIVADGECCPQRIPHQEHFDEARAALGEDKA